MKSTSLLNLKGKTLRSPISVAGPRPFPYTLVQSDTREVCTQPLLPGTLTALQETWLSQSPGTPQKQGWRERSSPSFFGSKIVAYSITGWLIKQSHQYVKHWSYISLICQIREPSAPQATCSALGPPWEILTNNSCFLCLKSQLQCLIKNRPTPKMCKFKFPIHILKKKPSGYMA